MSIVESSKGHLRNRSSTIRFDSRGSSITYSYTATSSNNVPVHDVDRMKFQSFKFPTSSFELPPRSSIYRDKKAAFSPLPPLPPTPGTPNIDIESYPGFQVNDGPASGAEPTPYPHEHSYSADVQVIDLLSMDPLDETYSDISVSPPPDDTITWAPYHWPSESSTAVNREFGLRQSPHGGQYTGRSSGFRDYFSYRFRRGVLLRRGPSTALIRFILLGSWLAMAVLIMLAVGLIIRFR